jgi:hypothetical protein
MNRLDFLVLILALNCFVVTILFPSTAQADKYACVDTLNKSKPRLISNPKECVSPGALVTISDTELAKLKDESASLSSSREKMAGGTKPSASRSGTVCKTFCGILNCCITYCCDRDGNCWIEDSLCPPKTGIRR